MLSSRYWIFFERQLNSIILFQNWIELNQKAMNITMWIHFNNFPIIYRFYTSCTYKTIIYCFKSKIKINWFYDRFDGTSITELSEGNDLGNNNNFLMIWVGSITSPKVRPRALVCDGDGRKVYNFLKFSDVIYECPLTVISNRILTRL